jgi:glycosyltransferase involved in cell wall biosynthesis
MGGGKFGRGIMRIVLFWVDFLHYHVARVNAAIRLAEQNGNEVFPIAVRSGSPEFPVPGYQHLLDGHIRILADSPQVGDLQSGRMAREMVMALNEINPDAVAIAGYATRVALAALGWCRRKQRGAILMTESQRRDFSRSWWKECVKCGLLYGFDAALVGGKPQYNYVRHLGMQPERIFLGYDVVDNDFWSEWADCVRLDAQEWRIRLNLPRYFFLTACRLVHKKNVAGLLRAYASYTSETQSVWPMVIVGDGPLRSQLEDLIQELGIKNNVRFLGYLSADNMGPIYGLASAFILASSHSEQWGLVVNEAMAAGLPVFVSNICGCVPDLVQEAITGYAFDPADEVGLAGLLTQCSNGIINLSQIGENAQQRIRVFSPQIFAENLIASAQVAVIHAQNRRINGWPLPLVLL